MNCPFGVKVLNSVREIDQREWERLFPAHLKNYHYLRTLEETLSGQFKFCYLALSRQSEIFCLAPCFLVDYPLDTTALGLVRKLLGWVGARAPHLAVFRMLVCGSPVGGGNLGIRDSSLLVEASGLLVEEMQKVAEKERASLLVFKDFSEEYTPLFHLLQRMGFHQMLSYPFVQLDLSWKSFEEYLGSLSRATRKDLKRKLKKLGQMPPLRMEVRNEVGEWLDQVYRLYLNTLEKGKTQFERVTKDFFEAVSRNMPRETKYFLWYLDDRLVAFDLCLAGKDVLIDEYIGMDYEVAYRYHLYFLTFRDIFNWCLENGVRRYESSALNYEPKKRLDFRFVSQYIYLKHRHPFGNLLFGVLCRILAPENFDPVLKALKDREHRQDA